MTDPWREIDLTDIEDGDLLKWSAADGGFVRLDPADLALTPGAAVEDSDGTQADDTRAINELIASLVAAGVIEEFSA